MNELIGSLVGFGPGFGVSLPDQRKHDLLDKAGLPLGGILIQAQMAGFDAESGESGHQIGHG
jgi:hypothetical protein